MSALTFMALLFIGCPLVLWATMRILETLYPPNERVPVRSDNDWTAD